MKGRIIVIMKSIEKITDLRKEGLNKSTNTLTEKIDMTAIDIVEITDKNQGIIIDKKTAIIATIMTVTVAKRKDTMIKHQTETATNDPMMTKETRIKITSQRAGMERTENTSM